MHHRTDLITCKEVQLIINGKVLIYSAVRIGRNIHKSILTYSKQQSHYIQKSDKIREIDFIKALISTLDKKIYF